MRYPHDLLPYPGLHHLDPPGPHRRHVLLPGDQEGEEAAEDEKEEEPDPQHVYLHWTRHVQDEQEDGPGCRS